MTRKRRRFRFVTDKAFGKNRDYGLVHEWAKVFLISVRIIWFMRKLMREWNRHLPIDDFDRSIPMKTTNNCWRFSLWIDVLGNLARNRLLINIIYVSEFMWPTRICLVHFWVLKRCLGFYGHFYVNYMIVYYSTPFVSIQVNIFISKYFQKYHEVIAETRSKSNPVKHFDC